MKPAFRASAIRRVFMTADAVGGVWTYALDLAEGFAEHGVRVTLAVLGPAPDAAQRADALAIPGLALLETGPELDWTAPTPAALDKVVDGLRGLANDSDADLVHLNSPVLAAGGTFDRPVVSVAHSCLASWWGGVRQTDMPEDFRWRAQRHRRGLLASDAVIAPSAAFADVTARTYDMPRPFVVHNGRRAPARFAWPKQRMVCTAGRLWDDGKNIGVLDAAAARIDAPLLAAGPLRGPHGEERGLDHARALGTLPAQAVRRTFGQARIFASAAVYEPFGLGVLEAAQARCALVLSDIPTFRELWDGAALFVPAHDVEGFAQAIQTLLDDTDETVRLAQAAAKRARRYSVAAMVRGVLEVYGALRPLGRPAREEEVAA